MACKCANRLLAIKALAQLDIPELLPLPTTKVVQAFEGLIQKINLLLDARKTLAKEENELQTARAIKAEVDKKKVEESGQAQNVEEVDADGEEADADGEDAEGEDVEMTDAPGEAMGDAEDAARPSSSRSNNTRTKRSVSVLSAASSRASRRKK